jgi:hypothetical protein
MLCESVSASRVVPTALPYLNDMMAPLKRGSGEVRKRDCPTYRRLSLPSRGCQARNQGIANCDRDPVAGANMGRRPQVIVEPSDGKIPYQPWAAARKDQLRRDHVNPRTMADIDPQTRCFPPGVLRMTYSEYATFQITQLPGYVLMLYEYTHTFRVIPIDGRPHVGKTVRLWMGDSRGRWEGNTLVVDVANHNDQTWLDIVGTFHSDALHVVERWTIVDETRMLDRPSK